MQCEDSNKVRVIHHKECMMTAAVATRRVRLLESRLLRWVPP